MSDYERGYRAAVDDIRASADHWEQFEVARLVTGALRAATETTEANLTDGGWYCDEPSHTAPRCLARAEGLRWNG